MTNRSRIRIWLPLLLAAACSSPMEDVPDTVALNEPQANAWWNRIVRVTLTPTQVSLAPGATQQFSAQAYTVYNWVKWATIYWSATGGTVSSTGLYTAGTTPGTYRVIAASYNGTADTSSVTITGSTPPTPPTLTFTASPTSVVSGGSATLSWVARYASGCTADSAWSGPRDTVGTASTGALTATRRYSLTCSGPGGSITGLATVTVTSGSPPPPPPMTPYLYPLKVSADRRALVDQNGRPFLLVGDAAWSLIVQPSRADVDLYLDNRKQLGFNFILINLIEHKYATNAPRNYYGAAPFTGRTFTTPNEAYFSQADYVIQAAAQRGIVVALDATYLGASCNQEGWCSDMQAGTDADLNAWGLYVGNRYKNYDNIVHVIGGDTDPSPVKSRLDAFISGLRSVDTRHLITAHTANPGEPTEWWGTPSWLTINNYYTYAQASYPEGQAAYRTSPVLPFFYLEAYYENSGGVTQQWLRSQSWWSILTGGVGHIYGNCPMWSFGAAAAANYCSGTDWKGQLNSQGAKNMQNFASLLLPRFRSAWVPDNSQTVVTAGLGSPGTTYVLAAWQADGSTAIAYLPTSRTVTVTGTRLSGPNMRVSWFNPATGVTTVVGTYPTAARSFTPPGSGDWVLVLDNADLNLPLP